MPLPRIGIMGGGPAGLSLAMLLRQHRIPTTVIDSRSGLPARHNIQLPAGMTDLHERSGVKVLQECGIWDQFQPYIESRPQSSIVMTPDGTVTHSDKGEIGNRPETSRTALVSLLGAGLDEISWRRTMLRVERLAEGNVGVNIHEHGADRERLPDGVRHKFDFVVGADGARSRTRQALSEEVPQPSGVLYASFRIPEAETRFPHISALVGPGRCSIVGNKRVLTTHRSVKGSIVLMAAIQMAEDHETVREITQKANSETKEQILLDDERFFGGWGSPEVRQLLSEGIKSESFLTSPRGVPKNNWMRRRTEASIFHPLRSLPVNFKWVSRPCMTLIGDAAHLMTPWAGWGVNMAMLDALDLSRVMTDAWNSVVKEAEGGENSGALFREALAPGLAEFEDKMHLRAKASAQEAEVYGKAFFADNAAEELAKLVAARTE